MSLQCEGGTELLSILGHLSSDSVRCLSGLSLRDTAKTYYR